MRSVAHQARQLASIAIAGVLPAVRTFGMCFAHISSVVTSETINHDIPPAHPLSGTPNVIKLEVGFCQTLKLSAMQATMQDAKLHD